MPNRDKRYSAAVMLAAFIACLIMLITVPLFNPAHAQNNLQPKPDKANKLVLGGVTSFQYWTPTELGLNNITEPANPAFTADTSIVDGVTVHSVALTINCTQPADIYMRVYDETGASIGNFKLVTAMPAGANQVYVATELAPNSTAGTLAVTVRFPQRFFSFNAQNTGATPGTCAGRLFMNYN